MVVNDRSQPVDSTPSQSPNGGVHDAIRQTPATHVDVALGSVQAVLHAPQFIGLLRVSTSQPFAGLASQSANPALHAPITHAPETQLAEAFENEHARPHAPQWAALDESCASQPLVAFASQSE